MFRSAIVLVAILLGADFVWIVLPELERPGIERLPTDAAEAGIAAKQRNDAAWAARVAAVRGDLWADYSFTYAELLWNKQGGTTEISPAVEQARLALDRALVDGPERSAAWLLLAGLALRYKLPDLNGAELLKMSYYTGPSEYYLMSLRLMIATSSDAIKDAELQRLVARELRLLLARNQQPVIKEAYRQASVVGQSVIEQTVGAIDPSFRESLRPDLPN